MSDPLPLTFDEQVDRMEEQSLKVQLTCEERADVQRRADAGEVPSWPEVKRYESTVEALEDRVAQLEGEIACAMEVLQPNVPESGLVDACRQVKQAAISEADNSEKLEAELKKAQRIADIERGQRERLALCPDHRDKTTGRCIVCQVEERTRQEIKADRACMEQQL